MTILFVRRVVIVVICVSVCAYFIKTRIIGHRRHFVKSSQSAAINWQDAGKYIGRPVVVEGEIVSSKNTGKVCFLDFDRHFDGKLALVIFSSSFLKFPENPETYYLNKTVRISGTVEEYNGRPEIVLDDVAQIVVKDK